MEVLGRSELGEALTAWALHEWQGRLRPRLPEAATRLSSEAARFPTIQALLQSRVNVIAGMLAAGVAECCRVRITAGDMPAVLVMGAQPVIAWWCSTCSTCSDARH